MTLSANPLKNVRGGCSWRFNASARCNSSWLESSGFISFQIVGQEGLQLLASVKEPGTHRADVAIHDGGDFLVRQPLHVVQRDHQAVDRGELLHRRVELLLEFAQRGDAKALPGPPPGGRAAR